ncbi:MAG: hypothetical protein HS116_18530 [Planctomycetes bacterium]|nr:hypothetical protein [Planctomycetota bacterium]
MPHEFTIDAVDFEHPAAAAGRYSLGSMTVGAEVHDRVRYHPKGVRGSYTTEGGLIAVPIACRVRYIANSVAGLYQMFESDKDAWQGSPGFLIGEPGGDDYDDCELDAAQIVRDPTATGRGTGQCFMDVEYRFTSYAGKA